MELELFFIIMSVFFVCNFFILSIIYFQRESDYFHLLITLLYIL